MRTQPKIRSSRYYWDGVNRVAVVTEGEPGCFDDNPEPNPELLKAVFALGDIAHMGVSETWGDAGAGERTWERAGRPTGTR